MLLVRVDMDLGGDAALSQLPVNQGRAVRAVRVHTTVVQRHRAGLFVEMENIADLHVNSVSFSSGPEGLSVGRDVGRSIDNRPVDMAGDRVQLVYGGVGPGLRTRGEQQSKVRAGGH